MNQIIFDGTITQRAHRQWSRAGLRLALLMQYTLFGLVIGVQGVVWGDVKAGLSLSEGVFGSAMMLTPLVGFITLSASGLWQRQGERPLALAGLLAITGALLILASAQNLGLFLVARVLTGLGFALLDSAVNNAVLKWEQASGRRLVGLLYALLSGGMAAGALAGGVFSVSGWSYREILQVLVPGLVVVTVMTALAPYPPRQLLAQPAAAPPIFVVLRSRHGLVLLGLVFIAVAGEAVADLWGVVYLRASGADALVSSAVFALFNGAMILGRLLSGSVLARWGARTLLRCAGVGLASSVALLAVGGEALSATAFSVLGLALGGVAPTVLAVARSRPTDERAAVVNGMVATTYLGFVVTPPTVGWLAELFGLQPTLLLVLAALLVAMRCLTSAIEPHSRHGARVARSQAR